MLMHAVDVEVSDGLTVAAALTWVATPLHVDASAIGAAELRERLTRGEGCKRFVVSGQFAFATVHTSPNIILANFISTEKQVDLKKENEWWESDC